MPTELTQLEGWLLDLYPGQDGGLNLWLVQKDGKRYQLRQEFPVTFYAAGENARLRALWKWLKAQPVPVKLERAQRRDLFTGEVTVLSIEVRDPVKQPGLFAQV